MTSTSYRKFKFRLFRFCEAMFHNILVLQYLKRSQWSSHKTWLSPRCQINWVRLSGVSDTADIWRKRIPPRNQNHIKIYFNKKMRGTRGSKSWRNRDNKSRDAVPLKFLICSLEQAGPVLCSDLFLIVDRWRGFEPTMTWQPGDHWAALIRFNFCELEYEQRTVKLLIIYTIILYYISFYISS